MNNGTIFQITQAIIALMVVSIIPISYFTGMDIPEGIMAIEGAVIMHYFSEVIRNRLK